MKDLPYVKETRGKCPHCHYQVHFEEPSAVDFQHPATTSYNSRHDPYMRVDGDNDYIMVYSSKCPNCRKPIVVAEIQQGSNFDIKIVHPFNRVRPVPPEVPKIIADDFIEASSVIAFSEKASAALSRRCLQNMLIDRGAPNNVHLVKQIEWALPDLPSYIQKDVDNVRIIGNYGAHPKKSKSTGLIVEVEPNEAEWNLEVLEALFDFYYVKPAAAEKRRLTFKKKIADAKKPTPKTP